MKIQKSNLPLNHSFNDFIFDENIAKKDCEFINTGCAYLGSFNQKEKQSNKFYFCCIVKSKLNNKWYTYCEWGRLGGSVDFQFYEFDTKDESYKQYIKQIESKNTKRGILSKIGNITTLIAKPNKDLYLVRDITKVKTNICIITSKITKVQSTSSSFDSETAKLLADLKAGNISYTKNNFSSGFVPSIEAINEARLILKEAAKASTKELTELTKLLYSKIPKVTSLGQKINLHANDIKLWFEDLDAFEDAFNNLNGTTVVSSLTYDIKYINKTNQSWFNVENIIKNSTRNRHSYLNKDMKILNVWEVTNQPKWFEEKQKEISKEYNGSITPMVFQPTRSDLEKSCNCALLCHGSRSVNIGGILSTGFRLPKFLKGVQINGALIGNGVYHADDWKKSAGYTSIDNGYWSNGGGKIINRKAFMFLNDVILGNSYTIQYPKHFDSPPKNYHSVVALEGGSFQNREYVIYDIKSFFPKYLIEFEI